MRNIRADFVRKPGQLQSRRLFSLQLSEPYPVTGEGKERSKSVKYKTLFFQFASFGNDKKEGKYHFYRTRVRSLVMLVTN